MELETEVRRALDVAKYTLDKLEVGGARGVHEQTILLDGVGYVRGEC
jgi:hypothetical protein